MITDHLYQPDGEYLPLDEAIRRIATSFRRVILDRCRGDSVVRKRYLDLISHSAPQSALEAHLSLLGVTVWVRVADENEHEAVTFLLRPNQDVFVNYDSQLKREKAHKTILKLADLLGYQVAEWMTFFEVTIQHKLSMGIARELTLHQRFREALDREGLEGIDEFEFGTGTIRMSVMAKDDIAGKAGIIAAICAVLPHVSFQIEIPPEEKPWCAELDSTSDQEGNLDSSRSPKP